MDIREFILLIASIHGIIMSLVLVKRNWQTNLNLVLLLLSVSLFLLIQLVAPFSKFPKISILSYALIYSYIPFYVLHIQNNLTKNIVKKNWLLFLPAGAFILACLPYLFKSNVDLFSEQFESLILMDLIAITVNVLLLIKTSQSLGLQKSKQALKPNHLFHGLMICSSLLWFMGILEASQLFILPFTLDLDSVFIGMSLFIFGIGYFFIYQDKQIEKPTVRYEKLSVSMAEQEVISESLLAFLKSDKPYLNPACSLSDIAAAIGVEKTKLSYVANRYMQTNFNRMMNELRIKEFLRLVEEQQLDIYDLTGVALQAGFKSKSTFFKAFKDFYGVSPRQYLDRKHSKIEVDMNSN